MRKLAISQELFAKAKVFFPGGVNSPVRAFRSVSAEPFVVERGEGAYLIDVDGNRYIDYINSWGPLVLGHAHPLVVEEISKQAALGTSYGACSERENQLAELVLSLYPSIEKIRFVNSGTEAGMAVVRLARAFTGRPKIIKFAGCYHGHADSFLVQAGSGVATLGLPDSPGVSQSVVSDTLTAQFNDLTNVELLVEAHKNDVAAIIVEPVVGNSGLILPEDNFLQGLRDICNQNGILLIFDEVMTGFRVAVGGAQQAYRISPDLTMLGKVIGGGLPVGAYGGRREIMEMIAPAGPVYQAGTLSGNPLAMAAGYITIREWIKPGIFEKTAEVAAKLVSEFNSLSKHFNIPVFSSSIGTMFGFFFQTGPVNNFQDAKRSDLERFKRFFNLMLESGVFFAPSQFEAGFVSAAHVGEPLEATLQAMNRAFERL